MLIRAASRTASRCRGACRRPAGRVRRCRLRQRSDDPAMAAERGLLHVLARALTPGGQILQSSVSRVSGQSFRAHAASSCSNRRSARLTVGDMESQLDRDRAQRVAVPAICRGDGLASVVAIEQAAQERPTARPVAASDLARRPVIGQDRLGELRVTVSGSVVIELVPRMTCVDEGEVDRARTAEPREDLRHGQERRCDDPADHRWVTAPRPRLRDAHDTATHRIERDVPHHLEHMAVALDQRPVITPLKKRADTAMPAVEGLGMPQFNCCMPRSRLPGACARAGGSGCPSGNTQGRPTPAVRRRARGAGERPADHCRRGIASLGRCRARRRGRSLGDEETKRSGHALDSARPTGSRPPETREC